LWKKGSNLHEGTNSPVETQLEVCVLPGYFGEQPFVPHPVSQKP
jgi:hypothetical protein